MEVPMFFSTNRIAEEAMYACLPHHAMSLIDHFPGRPQRPREAQLEQRRKHPRLRQRTELWEFIMPSTFGR